LPFEPYPFPISERYRERTAVIFPFNIVIFKSPHRPLALFQLPIPEPYSQRFVRMFRFKIGKFPTVELSTQPSRSPIPHPYDELFALIVQFIITPSSTAEWPLQLSRASYWVIGDDRIELPLSCELQIQCLHCLRWSAESRRYSPHRSRLLSARRLIQSALGHELLQFESQNGW
jgi:hypothetical protein